MLNKSQAPYHFIASYTLTSELLFKSSRTFSNRLKHSSGVPEYYDNILFTYLTFFLYFKNHCDKFL